VYREQYDLLAKTLEICVGAFSIVHWAILGLVLFTLGFPAARILKRAGLSGWWTILAMIPYANVIGLWAFAFARWPALEAAKDSSIDAGQ
jgi:hypothetical protein